MATEEPGRLKVKEAKANRNPYAIPTSNSTQELHNVSIHESALQEIECSRTLEVKQVKANISKHAVIVTDRLQMVGHYWLISRIYQLITAYNWRLIDTIRMVPWLYLIVALRLLCGSTLLSIGIILFIESDPDAITFGLLAIFVLVQVALVGVSVRAFWEAYSLKYETPTTFGFFWCAVLMETVVCSSLPFVLSKHLIVYAYIDIFCFLGINLVYELNIIAWLCLLPFILLVAVIEFAVRVCTCHAACPRKEPIVIKCHYTLYPYMASVFIETVCAICRAPFTEADTICRFKCNISHIFHEQCILPAIKQNPTCPICRQFAEFA